MLQSVVKSQIPTGGSKSPHHKAMTGKNCDYLTLEDHENNHFYNRRISSYSDLQPNTRSNSFQSFVHFPLSDYQCYPGHISSKANVYPHNCSNINNVAHHGNASAYLKKRHHGPKCPAPPIFEYPFQKEQRNNHLRQVSERAPHHPPCLAIFHPEGLLPDVQIEGYNVTCGDAHTLYNDFSKIQPTDDDRERYNKKNRHKTLLLAKKGTVIKQEELPQEHKLKIDHPKNGDQQLNRILKKRGRGNRATSSNTLNQGFIGFMGTNFPARLYDLLTLSDDQTNGLSSAISWLPHGRSWIVNDKVQFLKKSSSHFQISKYESFIRQVNGWGYKRITQGPDVNSYYHEKFLRGMPHLVQDMKRQKKSIDQKLCPNFKVDEPDFYAISTKYPLLDYYNKDGVERITLGANKDHKKDSISSSKNKSAQSKSFKQTKTSIKKTKYNGGVQEKERNSPTTKRAKIEKTVMRKVSFCSSEKGISPLYDDSAPTTSLTTQDDMKTSSLISSASNCYVSEVKDFWTVAEDKNDTLIFLETPQNAVTNVRRKWPSWAPASSLMSVFLSPHHEGEEKSKTPQDEYSDKEYHTEFPKLQEDDHDDDEFDSHMVEFIEELFVNENIG